MTTGYHSIKLQSTFDFQPEATNLHEWGRWQPPLPTQRDFEILQELIEGSEEARAIFRLLRSSPPEVAAIGCLVLRLFERIKPPQ